MTSNREDIFKALLKEYCKIEDGKKAHLTKDYILSIEPIIKKIVSKMGTGRCKTLRFDKNFIKEYMEVINYVEANTKK